MIIDLTKKFIFISVPKTGSTSIMLQLDPDSGHQPPHIYHAQTRDIPEDLAEEYRVFLFHRNPLERFASTFFDGIVNDGHKEVWSQPLQKYSGKFKDFCLDFKELDINKDIHFVPQWTFLDCEYPKTKIFTYSFEEWEKSIQEVNKEFGINLDPKIKKRPSGRPPISWVFDDESESAIRDFYKEDYKLFNYV